MEQKKKLFILSNKSGGFMDYAKNINVIKKSGKEVVFDRDMIYFAIQKANDTVGKNVQIPNGLVERISMDVENDCFAYGRAVTTE